MKIILFVFIYKISNNAYNRTDESSQKVNCREFCFEILTNKKIW